MLQDRKCDKSPENRLKKAFLYMQEKLKKTIKNARNRSAYNTLHSYKRGAEC